MRGVAGKVDVEDANWKTIFQRYAAALSGCLLSIRFSCFAYRLRAIAGCTHLTIGSRHLRRMIKFHELLPFPEAKYLLFLCFYLF